MVETRPVSRPGLLLEQGAAHCGDLGLDDDDEEEEDDNGDDGDGGGDSHDGHDDVHDGDDDDDGVELGHHPCEPSSCPHSPAPASRDPHNVNSSITTCRTSSLARAQTKELSVTVLQF